MRNVLVFIVYLHTVRREAKLSAEVNGKRISGSSSFALFINGSSVCICIIRGTYVFAAVLFFSFVDQIT